MTRDPAHACETLDHFNASLRILQPTVLILQGEGVQRWTKDALRNEKRITPYLSWRSTIRALPPTLTMLE